MIGVRAVRILSFTFAFGSVATNLHALPPKEVYAPVEKIFIAPGFDDNDNVQVSLFGNFTDTCYRVGPTGHSVDHQNREIKIWAKAYDYSSREFVCLDVLTPFLLNISVGLLQEGTYTVKVVGLNISQPLNIAHSTTDSPDEYLYAPVTHTKISTLPNGMQKVAFSGQFQRLINGCMKLKETKFEITSNNILVVLPIAEVIEDNKQCVGVPIDFDGEISFHAFTDVGLLHVRVANGNSQTQLINTP